MIVETLIKDVAWTSNGVRCNDEKIGEKIYEFLYELILDSHLYVTKAIGFNIVNRTFRNKSGTYIARNVQIGESYAEMMINLQDKVFLDTVDPLVEANCKCGVVRTDVITTPLLYTKDYLCRVVEGNCVLRLKLATDCGYRTLQDTSKQLDTKFFPMNTYFNILDYVRVLPKSSDFKTTELRFYNGMTMEILQKMLIRYMGMIQNEHISEEEAAWVYSFTL